MIAAYGIAGDNGTRLHSIRETFSGVTRGWCGVILHLRRGVWSIPSANQVVCRRCLHSRPDSVVTRGASWTAAEGGQG